MGMFCQINLCKPTNHAYQPGELISGVIKCALYEPMEFERITTSLKGSGQLKVCVKNSQRNKRNSYSVNETYVDIDDVISATKTSVPRGCYQIKYNFKIPERLPPTLEYKKKMIRYTIKCRIRYYVRIKFERPGWFAFTKHFRKEINLVSPIMPQLLMEPLAYGESKKLMRLFSRKNANVSLKATILNSIVPPGGKIQINFEINNDSNIMIKSIEAKVIEVYSFKASGHNDVKIYEEVPNIDYKYANIHAGVTKSWPLAINLPNDVVTLQNSKLVMRDYMVRIIAQLPIPHKNLTLDIPIQIGELTSQLQINELASNSVGECQVQETISKAATHDEPPPSYWEVMGETTSMDRLDEDIDEGETFTRF